MQVLWWFFMYCIVDFALQVIAVFETATIDRSHPDKMIMNGIKIAPWQLTIAMPICGVGVLIK